MVRIIFILSIFFFSLNINYLYAQNTQSQSSIAGRQIGQTAGSMAGGAAGNFASGGNIAATTAGSEVGRQVGGIAGEQAFIAIDNQVNTFTTESNDSSSENEGAQSPSLNGIELGGTEKEIPSLLDLK
jgi:hypothetical protein